jgi:hypothetical protein
MALDINSELDFGESSPHKKENAILVLCFSICFGIIAAYQFRFCCEHDHFKQSAERKFERHMKKHAKRVNKYREHASDGSDEKPVASARDAPEAGEFHGLGEEEASDIKEVR